MTRSSSLRAGLAAATLFVTAGAASAAATPWSGDGRAAVRLVTARDGAGPSPLAAGLEFRFAPGWHGYWRTPGDAGLPPAADWAGTPGLDDVTVGWPTPHRLVVSGLQNAVYDGNVTLPVDLAFAGPAAPAELRVSVDYAACGKVCVPYHADLTLPLPAGAGGASAEAPLIAAARASVPSTPAGAGFSVTRQAVVDEGAGRQLVVDLASAAQPFSAPDLFVEGAGAGLPPAPTVALGRGGRTATLTVPLPALEAGSAAQPLSLTLVDGARAARFDGPPPAAVERRGGGLGAALLAALLGGLILNLMPCVLPVLSLKLAGLARQSGEGRRAARAGFAATGLGIVSCFLALAAATIGLKASGAAIGWGIQFQQPWFLAAMAAVTVLFSANLFDWFHVGLPPGLAGFGGRTARPAWVASFVTGAFATLLATPCSAPFVGTAVGFALAGGPAEILAVFLGLGLGMALPFLLAALVPGVARWLPRPGAWMLTLRRVLGLLLLGTAAWLLWVLADVAGVTAAAATALPLAGLLALLGRAATRPMPRGTGLAAAGLAGLALLAAVAVPASGAGPGAAEDGAIAFDPAALDRLVAEGRTVLVDVSAGWCLTCKVNDLAALKTAAVRSRLDRPGTAVMRADWSRPDPTVARYIQSFGRYGLPLDVVYGPRRPAGEALPELLTAAGVVEALDRASAPPARADASR